MKRIFNIKVVSWSDHNKSHKPSFKKTQIANNFCTDARIVTLPLCVRWLFLGLVLECGNSNSDTLMISERQVNALLTTRLGAMNALTQLQSLQMVSFEIIEHSIQNRIELNRKEEKRNEKKRIEENADVAKTEKKIPSTQVSKAAHRGCIDEFKFHAISTELFSKCSDRAQRSWLAAYPSTDWIVQECLKANAWIVSNPKKSPKDFQRFFNNWLSQGFESYRKGLSSRRMTQSEINAQAASEILNKMNQEERDAKNTHNAG